MTGRSGDRGDRNDRPSWREIDRRKDRSKHVKQDRTGAMPHKQTDIGMKRYRKAVDEMLFSGKQLDTPKAVKAREALHKKYGDPAFEESVKKFVNKYGIPLHWETLMMMIECKDPEIVRPSMEALASMAGEQSPSEKMLFINSLKIMARKSPDKETVTLARNLVNELA